jgi:AraC-like DNA-binding protein
LLYRLNAENVALFDHCGERHFPTRAQPHPLSKKLLPMLDRLPHAPLHRFPLIDTRNADAFRDISFNAFGTRGFDLREDQPTFRAAMNWVWLKHIDLGFMSFNGSFGCSVTPHIVRQQFCVRGSARTSLGNRQFIIDHDGTCVIPAGMEARHNFAGNYAELRLRIDEAALRTKLGAMIGKPVPAGIEFQAPSSFGNPALTRLRRLIGHLVSELGREDLPATAVAQYEQSVIVNFLDANRHDFSHLLERAPPAAEPWQLRRAEDYIEANWSLPLTIEALLEVTGADARSLASAFQQARGISPMAFLKQVRLKHARRLLQTPGGNTSVTHVAHYFGFSSSGRFAKDYRSAFGELPSVTLAQSRRRKT